MVSQLPIFEHLAELRRRLLIIFVVWLVLFLLGAYYASELYNLIARPLINNLPQEGNLIAVDVASPFVAPLKLSAFVAMFITLPVAFVQVWRFIAPGLYQQERRLALPLIIATLTFFYAGALFVYFIVTPTALGFFYRVAPEEVQIMTDINRYLSFILRLAFVFGVAFELPIAIFILVRSGLVKLTWLSSNRAYVIVGCFVMAMLLTPPDVFSQVLLAIPLCLLYEAGILFARWGNNNSSRIKNEGRIKNKSRVNKKSN